MMLDNISPLLYIAAGAFFFFRWVVRDMNRNG
jgi:hypothetical protein